MPALDRVIDDALAEDVGHGDLTTDAIVPAGLRGTAAVVVREPGVVCGLDAAFAAVRRLDHGAAMERLVEDGALVEQAPVAVARFEASLRALLTAERTALNLVQRMSGIATATRRYVEAVGGTGVEVLDTRKTAPGLRDLDKAAVACGGGTNHRRGLDDAVLIKDNHLAVAGSVAAAVELVRREHPGRPVEVEADTVEQLEQALAAGAEVVLLDNMAPEMLRRAVRITNGRARLEASGGITIETIREVAETGVDAISVGALTHSVRALDIAMEVTPSAP
ncbi:MAG TPA: carboxylating nicotinate-nucleotide diphosphorylase [Gaiellales bacterium]|jgi:nicotinate-nucleotide pyrophosphorylase (carboxylating)|nr:carboxylating nicotinate-nucleotide diphosphorylase [Gaiellales bacterium]